MIERLRRAIIDNAQGNDFECKKLDSAVAELSELPDLSISETLRTLSESTEPKFRAYSVGIAAKLQCSIASQLAETLLSDQQSYVRVEACDAARVLGLGALADRLAQVLLEDKDEMVRDAAAVALSKIGPPEIIPLMVKAAQSETGVDHEGVPIQGTILRAIESIREKHRLL